MKGQASRGLGSDVGLLTAVPIPYGAQITIVSEPEETGGKWIAKALASSLGILTIQSECRLTTGERFIVVRRWQHAPSAFLHKALLAEQLETLAEQAEQRALKALQTR